MGGDRVGGSILCGDIEGEGRPLHGCEGSGRCHDSVCVGILKIAVISWKKKQITSQPPRGSRVFFLRARPPRADAGCTVAASPVSFGFHNQAMQDLGPHHRVRLTFRPVFSRRTLKASQSLSAILIRTRQWRSETLSHFRQPFCQCVGGQMFRLHLQRRPPFTTFVLARTCLGPS